MKIKRLEKDQLITYEFSSLEEFKNKIEEWKKEFREINKTDQIINSFGRDRSYERYCKELDDFLNRYAEG